MGDQKDIRQVNVDVSRVIPVFADEVVVASRIKAYRKENDPKHVEKEGNIEFIFLDQLSQPQKAISRVVVSKATAKGLLKVLNENIVKMETELKDRNMPKQPSIEIKPRQDKGYLG